MPEEHLSIVPTKNTPADLFDLRSTGKLSGMHPEMVLEFVRAELVSVAREDMSGNPFFDEGAIYRLRQIEYLRTKQQAHLRTIRLIMRLLDRVDAAEMELRHLRDRI